jgi:hypothetical protein
MASNVQDLPLGMDESDFKLAVEEGVFEAYRANGYVSINGEGDEVVDKSQVHDAIYLALKSSAIVRTLDEKSDKALTHGTLAKMIFSETPGANDEWDELDPLQQAVWTQVVKEAWNPVNPNYSGPVQRLVGERAPKLVLIKTRTTVDGTPGVDVVYLTSNEDLIFADFIAPLKASVRRAADRLAKNAALVSTRNKEMAGKAAREVDSGMKAAAQLAKSTLELMSGSNES